MRKIANARHVTLVIFCLVLAVAAGATVALCFAPVRAPKQLAEAQDPPTVPITAQQSDDSRGVQVRIVGGGERAVQANVSGVVTALDLEPGQEVKSGETHIAINGQPITFVQSATPPWQNVERTIWLNAGETTVRAVSVMLGDTVQTGQTLFTLNNPIKSATIVTLPNNLIAGERVLDFGDVVIPIEPQDSITDEDSLQKIANSAVYKQAVGGINTGGGASSTSSAGILGEPSADTGALQLNAKLQLKEPISVSVVTPSAIITNTNQKSCVVSGSIIYNIEIVGSELGRSFIYFTSSNQEDFVPPSEVDFKPDRGTVCK
jgi:biotin carboxyl carrier protein